MILKCIPIGMHFDYNIFMVLEIIFISFALGIVTNYVLAIKYLRGLRGELQEMKDTVLIPCGILWGSIVYILFFFIFKEVRYKDMENKYRLIISQSIFLALQIILVIVLGVLGYLKLPTNTPNEEVTTLLINIINSFISY